MAFIFKETSIPNDLLANVSHVEEVHLGKSIKIRTSIVMNDRLKLLVKGKRERKLLQNLYSAIDRAKRAAVKAGTRFSYNYTVKKIFIESKRKREDDVTPTSTESCKRKKVK